MTENNMDPAELVEKALLVQKLKSLVAALQMSESELPDKLTIHFQRKSNYGGDVIKVIFPLNSLRDDAILIFADAKDMLSAAQHEQVFRSHPLTVRRLPPVFTSVEAKIDPLYFEIMYFDAPAEFSKRIGKLTNVQIDKTNAGKITCSHPSQLKLVKREICGLVMNRAKGSVLSEGDGLEAAGDSNFGFESSPVQRGPEEHIRGEDDEMEVADKNDERRITGSFSKLSDEPEDFMGDHSIPKMQLASRKERDDKSEKKQRSAEDDVALMETHVDSISGFVKHADHVVLDKYTYEYVKRFENETLSKILKRNRVQIKVAPGDTSESLYGFIYPSNNKTTNENVAKAKDEFIPFYQNLHFDIKRKMIDCSSADAASIRKATDETRRQFKADVLITKVDVSNHLCLVLRRGDVEEVAQRFRKIAGIRSGKTLRNAGAGVQGTEATLTDITESPRFGKDDQEIRSSYAQQKMQSNHNRGLKSDDMEFTTNEGMHITIHTGDITKLSANAVVCPSDPYLTNESGGVAKAILDAAGAQLRGDCQEIMKRRGYKPLQMAECIVTSGLNLKYNAVIHVCGPTDPNYQQQFKSDLYWSFLNCLRTAEMNNMSSLAMPLIGSGAIRAAKTLCADALGRALIDFSGEPTGSKFVREVFLVNIDKDSSKAIQQCLQMAFDVQYHAAFPYSSSCATSESGFPQSAIGDIRYQLPKQQGESQGNAKKDQHGIAMQLTSQQHWPDLGESQVHRKKDQHDSGKQPRSQNLTTGERPTPGESVKQNEKGFSEGNAGDEEHYGNRRARHGINHVDKSKGSTSGKASDNEAHGGRPAADNEDHGGRSAADNEDHGGRPAAVDEDHGGRPAADNEAHGGRQAFHDVDPADKSVRSTGDHGGPQNEKRRDQCGDDKTEVCVICLGDKMTDPVKLKCQHQFCRVCIEKTFENDYRCPVCKTVCRPPKGNQPKGTMTHTFSNYWHLSGYEKDGIITIQYEIPSGTQTADHPSPGKFFRGASRTAYLPNNQEGREVLHLLEKAFDAGLVFTVGRSVTSGLDDTVTWNDIHHKTSRSGGPQNYGYPDPDYLKRLKEDLAAKGIQ